MYTYINYSGYLLNCTHVLFVLTYMCTQTLLQSIIKLFIAIFGLRALKRFALSCILCLIKQYIKASGQSISTSIIIMKSFLALSFILATALAKPDIVSRVLLHNFIISGHGQNWKLFLSHIFFTDCFQCYINIHTLEELNDYTIPLFMQ